MVMDNENRTYLGDGVYARRGMSDYAGVVIETSNGISVTNAIYLEPEVAGGFGGLPNETARDRRD